MKKIECMPVSFFHVLIVIILSIFLTTCGNDITSFENPPKAEKTIVIAEMMHETNSFSQVITKRRSFEADSLVYGDAIIPYVVEEDKQLGGFLQAVKDFGEEKIQVIPVLKATSMSGGPVDAGFYRHMKKTIVEGIVKAGKIDGIYISLHGTMGVEGMRDPEGDLLEAIRRRIGNDIPIGISHDLHANLTKKRMRHATFLVGYKTNPHRDHFETGYHSGKIMVNTVLGKVNPVMEWNKMRLLKGGGMNIDFLSPMRQIFGWMEDKEEDDDEVLCLSNFMVHIFIDDPELGWSTVAVTDGNREKAKKLADELADKNWAVRDVKHPEGTPAEEAVAIAKEKSFLRNFGTVVFCDASDAVGAGSPGGNTWILKALLEKGPELVSYVPLRDGVAARKAYKKDIGEDITLTVGGRLDPVYNRPLEYSGTVVKKLDIKRLGKVAIVKHKGIHLILTELADSYPKPSDFTELGLSLWKADVTVVKNLFPFRYNYILYNRKTVNVLTPGTSNVDVFKLKLDSIPRPIYPLDKIDSWRL